MIGGGAQEKRSGQHGCPLLRGLQLLVAEERSVQVTEQVIGRRLIRDLGWDEGEGV